MYLLVTPFLPPPPPRLDERVMFMVGLFLVAFGFFALLPMSDEFPQIATSCRSLSQSLSTPVV